MKRGLLHAGVALAALLLIAIAGLAGAWGGTRLRAAFMSAVARTAGTSTSDPALLVGAPLLLVDLALAALRMPQYS